MRPITTMRDALADPDIFGKILPGESWAAWRVMLIAAMGEPPQKQLVKACQAFKAFIG